LTVRPLLKGLPAQAAERYRAMLIEA